MDVTDHDIESYDKMVDWLERAARHEAAGNMPQAKRALTIALQHDAQTNIASVTVVAVR